MVLKLKRVAVAEPEPDMQLQSWQGVVRGLWSKASGDRPSEPRLAQPSASMHCLLWEKEAVHHPAPVQNFSLQEKKGVHKGKISVTDVVFLVFIGFLYPPPAWKVFLWGQKSSPNDFLSVVVYVFSSLLACTENPWRLPSRWAKSYDSYRRIASKSCHSIRITSVCWWSYLLPKQSETARRQSK